MTREWSLCSLVAPLCNFKVPRNITEDLNFCYACSQRNMQALASALSPYNLRLRNAPGSLPFQFDAKTIERGLNFTLATDLGVLDFLGEVAGLDFRKRAGL
jgi:hypothetical protein